MALHIPPMELMGIESVKCLVGVHMVGRNQYGYITPAFSGSPWWGEINLVRNGSLGNEQKMDENG